MVKKEEDYIQLKLLGCIDNKSKLSKFYGNEQINTKTIAGFVAVKLEITLEQYEEIREKFDQEIQTVKNLFNSDDRKNGFINIANFYRWYTEQPKVCCYCGVSQSDLSKYFNANNEQYENARQRGRQLEIERVNTISNEYSFKNCRLACYICNNAKSDFLSAKDFKPIAQGINQFWKDNDVEAEFPQNSNIWQ